MYWDGTPNSPYHGSFIAKSPFHAINKAKKQLINFLNATRIEIIQYNKHL